MASNETKAVTELRKGMVKDFNKVFSPKKNDSVPRFKKRFVKRLSLLETRWVNRLVRLK